MTHPNPLSQAALDNLLTELSHEYWRGRRRAARAVQRELLLTYRRMGATLVAAESATDHLRVAHELQVRFGAGFGGEQIGRLRLLHRYYSGEHPPREVLSWGHYAVLLTVSSRPEREFYEHLAAEHQWTVRELGHQLDVGLYHRPERLEVPGREARAVQPEELLAQPDVRAFLGLTE